VAREVTVRIEDADRGDGPFWQLALTPRFAQEVRGHEHRGRVNQLWFE
jgi:hypothetical protein